MPIIPKRTLFMCRSVGRRQNFSSPSWECTPCQAYEESGLLLEPGRQLETEPRPKFRRESHGRVPFSAQLLQQRLVFRSKRRKVGRFRALCERSRLLIIKFSSHHQFWLSFNALLSAFIRAHSLLPPTRRAHFLLHHNGKR